MIFHELTRQLHREAQCDECRKNCVDFQVEFAGGSRLRFCRNCFPNVVIKLHSDLMGWITRHMLT